MHWWSVSLISVGAKCTRGFKDPHKQNLKDLCRAIVEALLRKLFAEIHQYEYLLVLACGELIPEVCPNN